MKVFFDNEQMTRKEQAQRVREEANYVRDISRKEARDGVTAIDDLHFFYNEEGSR